MNLLYQHYIRWINHRSGIIRMVCGSFLIGILIASFSLFSETTLLWWGMGGMCVMLLFYRIPVIRIVGMAMLAAVVGILHYQWYEISQQTTLINFHNETVNVVGVIDQPIDSRIDFRYIIVSVESIKGAPATGRLMVSVPLYPEYRFGDRLAMKCQLVKPEPIEAFAYDRYLALRGITTLCRRPLISITERRTLMIHRQLFDDIRTYVNDVPKHHLPEPISSLFIAMLLGTRSGLPTELTDAFTITGTTHLIAISGMNMTIIVLSLHYVLIYGGVNRRHALWVVTPILIFYVVLIGSSASAVRAALMGWIVLFAYRMGRLSSAGGAVLFAASVMAIINPLIVRDDVGFQLSFLAVLGIMYAHEPIAKLFSWLPNPLGIREGLTMTLAAQLTTMPLLVYQFGRVSLIAPLANIVLVPVIAPLTIIGSALIMLSSLFPEVYWWWLLPQLLIHFLLTTVAYFSGIPLASVTL